MIITKKGGEKNLNKKILKPTAFILGVVMLGLLSVSYAAAQSDAGRYLPIVEKIAAKFNLNKDDVQAVFDEERDERHAEMQARFAERLDDLVNSGKITNEQKDAIIKKHEEMHNKMLELKDMEPEERKAEMQKVHEDFKNWAEEQGIDLPALGPMKFMHKRGVGHGMMMEKFEMKLEN